MPPTSMLDGTTPIRRLAGGLPAARPAIVPCDIDPGRAAGSAGRRRPELGAEDCLMDAVLGVLRDLLGRMERGQLTLGSMDPGFATMVEVDDLRVSLVVEYAPASHLLSPRELQVARLVAGGATNRAIATALEISLWTVSTHLRRVFAKLGVTCRAEMVAHLFSSGALSGSGPSQV